MTNDSEDVRLSTEVSSDGLVEMLAQAQEIAELFQRAIRLGYSISFTPKQLKTLLAICETGYLVKSDAKDAAAERPKTDATE